MCPLGMVMSGQEVEVVSILGGRGMSTRLAYMGVYPGVKLKVIANSFSGPIIIALGEKRFGIGFGMAHRIIVKPLEEKDE
ncbi:MAG TPA: ferrous iron transport protein A [Candidatus Desulfofervidus auxilii]|uniref:Ferrous iron transport protein A n=1 Tax=Desulfofervidus auxilii TaxID=1621989 RepID=A0A7V0IAD9_DESA2|nr:ferrous iron transport protein A [Candidatus Desulfofervidus auxilii]